MRKIIFGFLTLLLIFLGGCKNSSDNIPDNCGNNFTDVDEECDGNDLNGKTCTELGYYGGVLKCLPSCKLDIQECAAAGKCGDGVLQEDNGEECDGNTFVAGDSCESHNYYGGNLKCTNQCKLDLSECESAGKCGDGIVNGTESCDGTELNGQTCTELGYYGGELKCNDQCGFDLSGCDAVGKCGDGVLQAAKGEECDGNDLNEQSCSSLLNGGSGVLQCNDDCHFDFSQCEWCGDGIVNGTESCDGTDINNHTCTDLGYYETGNLTCSDDCTFDESGCAIVGKCGDGEVQSQYGESCDGTAFAGGLCEDSGYWFGTPVNCSSECVPVSDEGCHNVVSWGTDFEDSASVIRFLDDAIYVAGETNGALDGNVQAGQQDAFLTKIDSSGVKQWTRQWGTYGREFVSDLVGIYTDDNYTNEILLVVGGTDGVLGSFNSGGYDAFLTGFNLSGGKEFTKQWGTSNYDMAQGVIGYVGDVYVSGITAGAMDGPNKGWTDVFLTKYTIDGTLLWTRQWGSTEIEETKGIVFGYKTVSGYIASDGIYVSGYTKGNMEGVNSGGKDAFLTKYTLDGTLLWTRQWGSTEDDYVTSVMSDFDGNVYVLGTTSGSIGGNLSNGGKDIFLTKFDSSGVIQWTKQWGTYTDEEAAELIIDPWSVEYYISGTTGGSMNGNPSNGGNDIFLIKTNMNGVIQWVKQWGTNESDVAKSIMISFNFAGGADPFAEFVYISGATEGGFENYVNAGESDAFVLRYSLVP